jgi:hypothetical protein
VGGSGTISHTNGDAFSESIGSDIPHTVAPPPLGGAVALIGVFVQYRTDSGASKAALSTKDTSGEFENAQPTGAGGWVPPAPVCGEPAEARTPVSASTTRHMPTRVR